jgi:general secretion pathway protein D
MAAMSFGLLPLEFVDARTAVVELTEILRLGEPGGSRLRLVPIARLNSVVAVGPRIEDVEEARRWLAWLDQNSGAEEPRLFVHFVQNTRASELAESLNALFGDGGGEGAAAPRQTRAPIRDDVLEIDLTDEQDDFSAPDLGFGAPADAFGPTDAPLRITAENQRNALLITATPRDYRRIQSAIERLDVAPLQVLLEVTIVEVTLNDNLRYGLQWFFRFGDEGTASFGPSAVPSAVFPGFNFVFATENLRVALNALTDLTEVRIVSSPSLMVLNNETASLQVGDQVPVATQSVVAVSDPGAPIVNTIQYRDTGVILNVTPRVNNSGLVILDIEQDVSSVASTVTSGIDSPTIQQRKVTSTVAVGDGEMLALGGLISGSRALSRSGVPGLSDVPVLGGLFRSTSDNQNRTELLVLVLPKVVRGASDVRAVTAELRERLSAAAPFGDAR